MVKYLKLELISINFFLPISFLTSKNV